MPNLLVRRKYQTTSLGQISLRMNLSSEILDGKHKHVKSRGIYFFLFSLYTTIKQILEKSRNE